MISALYEAFWILQMMVLLIWKCRADGYSGKVFAILIAVGLIIVSDVSYYYFSSFTGLSRQISLLVENTIFSTIFFALPFLSELVIRDDDPLSEKIRRLTLILSVVSIVVYLVTFMVMPNDGKNFSTLFDFKNGTALEEGGQDLSVGLNTL